jgi:hypothetical protein
MRLRRIATGIGILALTASAQQKTAIVGGVSSTAPIEIDGTAMEPAPSWPLIDGDVVRTTSAPGLILTPDQSAITLMPETTVRVRELPAGQTWVFVREGALSIDTKNRNILICVASRLFQPAGAAKGSIQLDKSGTVLQTVTAGSLTELKGNSCNEAAGPVAGGTATAPTTNNGKKAAAALALALVGVIPAGFAAASGPPACASSAGCNFNPPPVSPSGP